MRKVIVRPFVISPIPSSEAPSGSRPISIKRISRVRMNWFVVGSVFGVGISFFMNFVFSTVIVPEYKQVMARHAEAQLAEEKEKKSEKPATSITAQPAAVAEVKPAPTPAPEPITYPRTLALQLGKGQTLLSMLLDNHVPESEAHRVIDALKPTVNPQKLKAGQKISVTLARHESIGDKAAVKELAIKLPNFSIVELERLNNGNFNVAATKETLTNHAFRAVGVVKTSLFQAGEDGNIPMSVMNDLVTAFSYDVDFQRDIHPGDKVEILMDRQTTADGRVGATGAVRYAALTLKGKKKEIFRFKDSSGELAWYDAKGNSIKKSLLRTPVSAVHITSGFGLRTRCLAIPSSTAGLILAHRLAPPSWRRVTARSSLKVGKPATETSLLFATTAPMKPPMAISAALAISKWAGT